MENKYDHLTSEAAIRQFWLEKNIYKPQENKPQFSIDTPPPTVSGALHLGHIFSYTQTDIIARYTRMSGFSVYYPFGFDDNGLATERFVEKKCDVRADQMERDKFISLCLEQTALAEQEFQLLWQRMGLSIDWQYDYSTISAKTRAVAQASFIDLFSKGFVYRSHEPVLYCSSCRTAIAQAELDDKEVPSVFYDIAFTDQNGSTIVIATTRPELLFSCVALLYNPADERYKHLAGTNVTVPLSGHLVPVLADDNVLPEKGTGLVMCCTFGDKTDIEWFKKFKLPYKPSIDRNGKFLSTTPLSGLSIAQGREKVVQELSAQGRVLKKRDIVHAVNIHERCKKEIEFLILPQWFIRLLPHKQSLIEQADLIEWYPLFMKARYKNWVENISWDWCISRQRRFGIPFPVWHCTQCQFIVLADYKDLPIDPQVNACPLVCPKCKSDKLTPDTDVMDTWNTSSLTPQIVMNLLNNETFFGQHAAPFVPMSMRPQAHDIIRTWAFYTIAKAWMHHKTIPWHSIVISGHVLSSEQEKLSKSRENSATTPDNLLKQYSADAIRYWTASGGLGQDIAFSDAQIRIGQKLVTKLWNAFRFVKTHIQAVQITNKPRDFGVVNEWLLHELHHCFSNYQLQFKQYEFSAALSEVERFFWHTFCDTYLEVIKNQLFNPEQYEQAHVAATKWTLCHVGFSILQLYAPYVPYITDVLYREIFESIIKEPSIHTTTFAMKDSRYVYDTSKRSMDWIVQLITHVRKLKSEYKLSLNAPLNMLVVVTTNSEIAQTIASQQQIIMGVTHAQHIECTAGTAVENSLTNDEGSFVATVFVS